MLSALVVQSTRVDILVNDKQLTTKDGKRYICKVCRSYIDKKKTPRKSEKEHFKYSNIPRSLKENLKKITNYAKLAQKRKLSKDDDQVFELNKLEAHLLKIVIPFIRIAHCPRGAYFKVRGNLILISADISHTMSRILPQNQNVLPVCFKRKLETFQDKENKKADDLSQLCFDLI